MRMPRRTGQRRVQHLCKLGAALAPAGQFARRHVMRLVAQHDAGQGAQHQLGIVARHAQAQAHVGELDFQVQGSVPGDHATHEHVAAAAGVFGEGVHRNVHAQIFAGAWHQVKRLEGNARAPRVVQRAQHIFGFADAYQFTQVRELQRHRAGSLHPHQAGFGADLVAQVLRGHGVVVAVGDAPALEFGLSQRLAGAIGVVGDQHLVAGLQHCQRHIGNGRQPAGHQHALQTALQRGQTLFQHVGGGRAVQAVGVAGLVFPFAAAHGGHVGEDDSRCLEHARLWGVKAFRGRVRVVDQAGDHVLHFNLSKARGIEKYRAGTSTSGTPWNWLRQATGVAPCKGESEATRSARSRGVFPFQMLHFWISCSGRMAS